MSIWEAPRYTSTYAGRLTGLRPERVRRWLKGYEYSYPLGNNSAKIVRQKPIIKHGDSKESIYASFLELIDLLFVKAFLKHGLSLQKIRKAFAEAEKIIGMPHFAHKDFFTDGSEIYLKIRDQQEEAESLLQLLTGGQWVIADIILQLADQIDFHIDTELAEKWYPCGREGLIVLDPQICYGAPTIINHGIITNNVLDLFIAENEDIDSVANWLKLNDNEIKAAVTFENSIAAVA